MTSGHSLDSPTLLEFSDDEVHAVLERLDRRRTLSGRWRAPTVTLLLTGLAAVAVTLTVPAGRAALDDAIGRFLAGGALPGKAVGTGALPEWVQRLQQETGSPVHVLARSGDEELLAYRTRSRALCFDFGNHVGVCIPPESEGGGVDSLFAGEFKDKPITLWGPTHTDSSGRWVLWGIANDLVARVDLRYADGTVSSAAGTNGFIVRADPARSPTEVVAFDDAGRELTRIDVQKRFELAPVGG